MSTLLDSGETPGRARSSAVGWVRSAAGGDKGIPNQPPGADLGRTGIANTDDVTRRRHSGRAAAQRDWAYTTSRSGPPSLGRAGDLIKANAAEIEADGQPGDRCGATVWPASRSVVAAQEFYEAAALALPPYRRDPADQPAPAESATPGPGRRGRRHRAVQRAN